MKRVSLLVICVFAVMSSGGKSTEKEVIETSTNPIIFADVPDMSMIRVGDTYYMSRTD